ncbi:MAG: PBP1A family penicillin-binding protein [Deltaproteobacteria bacterium]
MRAIRLIVLVSAGFLAGFLVFYYFTRDLPSLTTLRDYNPNLVTTVYSDDNRIIGEFYVERRVVVPLNSVPRDLIHAFLAAEDARFFKHEGISYMGILRALYKNLMAGKIVQGGSTITQQVAKSFFLSSERTLSRKMREAILAYRMEQSLSKEEILNLYLNQIYFGNGAYGVQSASENYFGKDVSRLTTAEGALLAGLPKAPSKYSPYAHPELARKRQEFILSRMLEEGFITKDEYVLALNAEIKFKHKKTDALWVGPYFTEHVRRHLEEKYGADALYKSGLKVYTTLNVEMQKAANDALRQGLTEYDRRRGFRGPVLSLKTKEELEQFIADADRRFASEPIEQGHAYRAVVGSVDRRDGSLTVMLGKKNGVVEATQMEWARLYNPTKDPDGGRPADLRKILRPGDVVDVDVISIPKREDAPLILSLTQESEAEASFVAMETFTGYVKAMTGGSDFSKTQFNRATQALRQPGSAFKPIIYASALDKNYTPATIVVDSPLVFEEELKEDKWKPRNYDEQFNGPITVRDALAKSRNIVTIKILKDIGVEHAIGYARLLGIKEPLAPDLSLALGSSATTLLEMTGAFATFANLGQRPEPIFIRMVTDREGNVLEEAAPALTPVLSPQTSYIMTSLLQGVVERGTGMRARALGRPAAGKTGTTNNLNDAWFIGYVPGMAAGAWLGYDSEARLGQGETGARAALPIWLKFMKEYVEGKPVRGFEMPDGIEFAKIDPDTGLLAGPTTEDPVFEVFKPGTAPTQVSTSTETKTGSNEFLLIDSDSAPVRPKKKNQVEEDID